MRAAELSIHPDFECPAVDALAAAVSRVGDVLTIRYWGSGNVDQLAIPATLPAPARTDGLWKHTCFELFVKPAGGDAYLEFNFSPSGQWAAYRFRSYRAGMEELEIAAPQIAWRADAGGGELSVALDLAGFNLAGARLAMTAVIELVGGEKSYWSLAHAEGKPDFHHPASFAADLPQKITELEP